MFFIRSKPYTQDVLGRGRQTRINRISNICPQQLDLTDPNLNFIKSVIDTLDMFYIRRDSEPKVYPIIITHERSILTKFLN